MPHYPKFVCHEYICMNSGVEEWVGFGWRAAGSKTLPQNSKESHGIATHL